MLSQIPRGQLLCSYGRSVSSAASLENIYDVAIIGGGMVGSALACALGKPSLHHPTSSSDDIDKEAFYSVYQETQPVNILRTYCRNEPFDRGPEGAHIGQSALAKGHSISGSGT